MKTKKTLIVSGIIVFIVVIAIVAIISISGSNLTGFAVTNPIKTCKEVQVPYDIQEAYEVQEPYQAIEEYRVPLKYEVISAVEGFTSSGLNYLTTLTINVRNVDTETGAFTVTMFFKTLNDAETSKNVQQYIMPGETKSFYQTYDNDWNEDVNTRYFVVSGEKTLTRTVTKYRTVTQYRTVTKYKTEEKCT